MDDLEPKRLPLRVHDAASVFKLRDSLAETIRYFSNKRGPLTGDDFRHFTAWVCEHLPQGIAHEAVEKSLLHLAGKKIDDSMAMEIAHRLAGNLRMLRAGRPVRPWTRQLTNEWMLLQIMRVTLRPHRKREENGAELELKIQAGSAAPMFIRSWWSHRRLSFTAKSAGFTKPWEDMPYISPYHFVLFRFYAYVEPALSNTRPGFKVVSFPPTVVRWNTKILRMRFRASSPAKCPIGKPDDFPCDRCPVGYEKCLAATHLRTYIVGDCLACGRKACYIDPEQPAACVNCTRAAEEGRNERIDHSPESEGPDLSPPDDQ